MEEHGQGDRMIQLVLATLLVEAVQGVLPVHSEVVLSCPEWDCQCPQETLWEVEALDQGMVPGRVRPVGMVGRCTCRFDGGCQWRLVRSGVG